MVRGVGLGGASQAGARTLVREMLSTHVVPLRFLQTTQHKVERLLSYCCEGQEEAIAA